jgi:LDH2 family malate/lactate/ureidoglycolate dehydrogenase
MTTNSWANYLEDVMADDQRGKATKVAESEARRFCESLLQANGVSAEDAAIVSDVFIQSDLRGEDSHGMRLLLHVVRRIKAGGDEIDIPPTVVSDRGATAIWDANRGLGQVVAAKAMNLAIAKAKEFGIGVVGVRNANSYTSAKYYPFLATQNNMIGISYANSGVQLVAPHGGASPVVGTNPVAIAAPVRNGDPFVLDMAVSGAMERVFQAHERGEELPSGWGLDMDGNETREPAKILQSRTLMPWGGYKGFGLGLAHEILTSVLMGGGVFGAGATGFIPYDGPMNVSQYFQAINIEHFVPLDVYFEGMERALGVTKASRLRPGFSEVAVPGERGFREERLRRQNGIPIQKSVVSAFNLLATEAGVAPMAEMAT